MNLELIAIKDKLNAEGEAQAMAVIPYLKILFPAIDEVSTEEAYQIFGSRAKFDYHRKEGNIHPIRGFNKKSRKFWSRVDVYNLKKAEQKVMKVV